MQVTAHEIANVARLIRTQHPGSILIVEGSTDIQVYAGFVDKTECELIYSHGRQKAVDAIDILEKDGFKGVLTIVDADFWNVGGYKPSSPNILITDTHDLETMILSSDAFSKIISDYVDTKKISRLSKPIRDKLLESALPIGCFRWISSSVKDDLNLRFKELDFEKFVDKNTLDVDVDILIVEVKNNSHYWTSTLVESEIKSKILTLMKEKHDHWQVCSGHDMVKILLIGLNNIFGNFGSNGIRERTLDRKIRTVYDYSFFCLTKLHSSIKDWEKTNPSFIVLE